MNNAPRVPERTLPERIPSVEWVARLLRRSVRPLMAGALVTVVAAAVDPTRAAAAPPSTAERSSAIVDQAVVPAGGGGCQQCGPSGCRHGHGSRHHRDCRNGVCAPYCPVRPSTFGFYGTQWRRWPGQGVVPVSDERAMTPATPPKSEVPAADEESRGPKPSALPAPDEESAADAANDRADERSRLPADAPLPPEPDAMPPEPPAPATQPSPEGPAESMNPDTELQEVPRGEQKSETPPAPRPEDQNLFDDSASRKVRRRIPVGDQLLRPIVAGSNQGVQPTAHQSAATVTEAEKPVAPGSGLRRVPLAVPRVVFDPRAETARLRQQK